MKILSTTSQPDVRLKVATLNTWHGLNGHGTVRFGSLESRSERLKRLEKQVEALQKIDADVLFLQEVNPLPFRAYWYADKLQKQCFYAAGNAGLKLGWGLPTNLNEGVAILCPQGWSAEIVGKKRLSGAFRFSPLRLAAVMSPFLSVQFHEGRAALAVRLTLPEGRRVGAFRGASSVLLAVTHFHHTPSMTRDVQNLMADARATGELTAEEEDFLLENFQAAEARRISEADILTDWLDGLRKPGEAVILAGDLNSEPGTPPIEIFARRGWIDAWRYAGKSEDTHEAATWDPPRNPLTGRAGELKLPYAHHNAAIAAFMKKVEKISRRIDFILFSPWQKNVKSEETEDVGCFGHLINVDRFGCGETLVSDHYGVAASFGC